MTVLAYIRATILTNITSPTLSRRIRALHLNRRLYYRRLYYRRHGA